MGPIGCPETSLINYHSTLRKIRKKTHTFHILLRYMFIKLMVILKVIGKTGICILCHKAFCAIRHFVP